LKVEGEDAAVFADLEAFGDVGDDFGVFGIPPHEALGADDAQDVVVVRAAAQSDPQIAAVGADLVQGRDHLWLGADALGHRRQRARLDHSGQSRCLARRALGKGRKRKKRHQRRAEHQAGDCAARRPRPFRCKISCHGLPPDCILALWRQVPPPLANRGAS